MCIKKTQAYEYGGKLYPTEGDAVTAAITEVASDLFKHHDGHPVKALLDRRDTLIELLSRHAALEKREDEQINVGDFVGGRSRHGLTYGYVNKVQPEGYRVHAKASECHRGVWISKATAEIVDPNTLVSSYVDQHIDRQEEEIRKEARL